MIASTRTRQKRATAQQQKDAAPRTNPFLKPREDEEEAPETMEDDPVLGSDLSVLGRALDGDDVPDGNGLWLVGAAGGVGVSTLADACGVNVHDSADSEPPWGGRVVIVTSAARTSLESARSLVRSSRDGTVPWEAVAMVLVHDRPASLVSKQTKQLARETLRMVRRGLAVPFMPELRETSDPALDLGVTRARKVTETLDKLAEKASPNKKKEL